jgi:hypothetical protein
MAHGWIYEHTGRGYLGIERDMAHTLGITRDRLAYDMEHITIFDMLRSCAACPSTLTVVASNEKTRQAPTISRRW